MTKAFVDTTILVDCLLKPTTRGRAAKAALNRFSETELPVYAIKEFKAGALRGYIWLHNTFVREGQFSRVILRIHGLTRSLQRNLASTSLEALAEASEYFGSLSSPEMIEQYGTKATGDSMQVDSYRLRLKELVFRAWKKRRSVTTRVVYSLSCYPEVSLSETTRGLIEFRPWKCRVQRECSLADPLRQQLSSVSILAETVKSMPKGREQAKRYHALHDIERAPRRPVTESMCMALGDAMFALFAPMDAIILTTNRKDHEPLATALGKSVETP